MYFITQDDINWCDARTTKIVSGFGRGRARDDDDLQIGRLAMCEAAKSYKKSKSRFKYWAGFYIKHGLYLNEYGYFAAGIRVHPDIYKNKKAVPLEDTAFFLRANENLEQLIINKDEIEKQLRTALPYVAKAIVNKEVYGIGHNETGKQ